MFFTGTSAIKVLKYYKVLKFYVIPMMDLQAAHIFFQQKICELDILLTRTVNILTTNKLVKLTML